MHDHLSASIVLALMFPLGAAAATPAEIDTLRQEIATLRSAYEARLQALEQRLDAALAAGTAPPSAPPALAQAAPVPTPAPAPAPAPAPSANAFNPAVSLILSGLYTHSSKDPASYHIGGIPLPPDAEVGPGTRGFSLAESELGLSASIDPWLRGAATIAFHPDNSVSVEEAYIQTTSLGAGLSIRAGRFLSSVGYLNSRHAHTWDFVDAPLAYQALLGTQYGDDGVRLGWLAPTDQYLELALEVGRGRSFPGGDNARNGAGMAAFALHTGGDLGASHNWRAGLSLLGAKADGQALSVDGAAGDPVDAAFSGNTRVWVADAVWKWAPQGNAARTSLLLQGEYLRSTRDGSLVYDPAASASAAAYRAVQSGWYLQGVYKFLPRWRVGLRVDRIDPGEPDFGANASLYDAAGYRPRKESLMLDFSTSEFSRVRLQLAQDRASPGGADRQLFLQYQTSLGAHGAHDY